MPEVEIFTTMLCPFCAAAKRLLECKGIAFTETDVMFSPGRRREMSERAGGDHRVPQIFVNGRHIGNCDRLYALDAVGELDSILEDAP
ncbi:MAG: glutaredoxin 3 [Alphaproteobacteria bacterium]